MRFYIPIRLPSLSNLRVHWRRMLKIKQGQKSATKLVMMNLKLPAPPPLLVVITRVGPGRLDDDNLAHACKYVRDQIAAEVGVDDGSELYTWECRQRRDKVFGVEVEILPRPDAPVKQRTPGC